LEAATQAQCSARPCLLLAFDTAFPEPVRRLRPIPDAMGVAMVLSPQQTAASRARIALTPSSEAPSRMQDSALEHLRCDIPAARSLPLLEMLAQNRHGAVVLDYLGALSLHVQVAAVA
jgi:hypothetical protein